MSNQYLRLDERTMLFSKDMLNFCKSQPQTIITKPIINQLIRSATAIGANYAEATNASSRLDFRNKIYVAKKETAETKYWLALMLEHASDKNTCIALFEESHYILMTFQRIANSLNQGQGTKAKARLRAKG
ncbi:four helix bundle protein [Candidatus Saccharibacteria bacterium]|nr:four helix bundle protein [Candidatus Saccharibacteria bacterium]